MGTTEERRPGRGRWRGTGGRRVLVMSVALNSAVVSVCVGGILSAPSSHWQINELEEWGWCGLRQRKRQRRVEGGVCGCWPRCGEMRTGPPRAQGPRGEYWRRSASGPGGKWGSKVGPLGRQSIHSPTVDSGTVGPWTGHWTVGVAVQGLLEGNWRSSVSLALFPHHRVHVCTTRPVPKPPCTSTTNETIVPFREHSTWRCLPRGRFVSVVSFLLDPPPNAQTGSTNNPGSARSGTRSSSRTGWRLWRKGLMEIGRAHV